MSVRRERLEILVCGGRPWGFSVKGGVESNKPLTISKVNSYTYSGQHFVDYENKKLYYGFSHCSHSQI